MDHRISRSMTRAKRQAVVCAKSRKIGYRSKGKALKFAERSAQITGQTLYVYECPFCSCWHLTKQVERSKAAS